MIKTVCYTDKTTRKGYMNIPVPTKPCKNKVRWYKDKTVVKKAV